MSSAAMNLDDEREVVTEAAMVLLAEGARFVVVMKRGRVQAARAVSCLALPVPGDRVLVASVAEEGIFILAVLVREAGARVDLRVDGDLRIHVPDGAVTIAAQEGVNVVSGTRVAMAAPEVDIKASRGSVVIDALSYVGNAVMAEVGKASLVARVLDRTVDRLTERLKRAYRSVEEVDQLRAGHVDYAAKKNMSLRGQNALVTASDLVKVDGAQIHVG